jgi:hypothetical protein
LQLTAEHYRKSAPPGTEYLIQILLQVLARPFYLLTTMHILMNPYYYRVANNTSGIHFAGGASGDYFIKGKNETFNDGYNADNAGNWMCSQADKVGSGKCARKHKGRPICHQEPAILSCKSTG